MSHAYDGLQRQFSGSSYDSMQSSGSSQDPMNYLSGDLYDGNSTSSHRDVAAADSAKWVCLEPGCDRICSRRFDLERHIKTHFSPRQIYTCEEGHWCRRYGRRGESGNLGGFARKDHYVQHRRDVHMEEIPKGRGSGNFDLERHVKTDSSPPSRGSGNLAKARVREDTGWSREVASGPSSGLNRPRPHCRP